MLQIQTHFSRYEDKFILNHQQANHLLRSLEPYITPDEYGKYSNCSVYCDTPDFYTLTRPGQGSYKQKLRMRCYGTPGEGDKVFLELKSKLVGVTYKRRISLTLAEARRYMWYGVPPAEQGQIFAEIDWYKNQYSLKPQVLVQYDRVAFSGRENPSLRFTLDTNIRSRDYSLDPSLPAGGLSLLAPGSALLEIKTPDAYPTWLARLLSEAEAYPGSFSKYRHAYMAHIQKEGTRCAG